MRLHDEFISGVKWLSDLERTYIQPITYTGRALCNVRPKKKGGGKGGMRQRS